MIRKSEERLAAKLGLPPPDSYSQEWECEVCDLKKPHEWLDDYCRTDLTGDDKAELMAIIVESMSDVLSSEMVMTEDVVRFKQFILEDYSLHKYLMDDWANWDATEEGFPITPVIRDLVRIAECKLQ